MSVEADLKGAGRLPMKGRLARAAFRVWKTVLQPDFRYLFILGHMRSGSSLLSHILMSHPSVSGLGERNATYRETTDFDTLAMQAHFRRALLRPRRYVVDQINHTRMTPKPDLLNRGDVRRIFLVREPAASLASMLGEFGDLYDFDTEKAQTYYIERLNAMCRMADHMSERDHSFFLTYDEMTRRPEETLEALSAFLDVTPALSPDYKIFSFTGLRGDPSQKIRTGTIVPPADIAEAVLPQGVPESIIDAYQETVERLRTACRNSLLPEG